MAPDGNNLTKGFHNYLERAIMQLTSPGQGMVSRKFPGPSFPFQQSVPLCNAAIIFVPLCNTAKSLLFILDYKGDIFLPLSRDFLVKYGCYFVLQLFHIYVKESSCEL
jgi:hypothetical protein